MKRTALLFFLLICFSVPLLSQVPLTTHVQIVKAEDARRYDSTLEKLMRSPDAAVRKRAALAAGRIGDEAALPALAGLLKSDPSADVRAMAAFAIGEAESIGGADAILSALNDPNAPAGVRARAVEAAGKIAAANSKDEKAKNLGSGILELLKREETQAPEPKVIRLGLTAVLRARPEGAAEIVRNFLANSDPATVADALNTLARLRARVANRDARDFLQTNVHAVVRANAARVLGAAEDKEAFDVLLKAAVEDPDPRVRVSAVRSLAALKDARAAASLLDRGEKLLSEYKKSKYADPVEKNELLEIATALGRILPNTGNERATKFLDRYIAADDGRSPEISIARLHVSPGEFSSRNEARALSNWRQYSTLAQIVGEFASIEPTTEKAKKMKAEAPEMARVTAEAFADDASKEEQKFVIAGPDFLRAFAQYKTDDLTGVLRQALKNKDVFIRATAAELLADTPPSRGNVTILEAAFTSALATDKHDNDAQLAMLDAMAKIDRAAAVDTLYTALDAPDYLVRKKAFELLDDAELLRRYPGAAAVVLNARAQKKHQVLPYDPKTGTKLGQVLNTDADYRRAVSRKNGAVKAIVSTQKGTFTIDLLPEDAPLTVDNFVKLARARYFNGLEVHRVVPNFVMQDGDPRGDGNGGPGWSIRCEINLVPYERGVVGMALSGKDTGGSQWFVTHSPQPHLDGGYTVFGKVNETGMKVVDNIVRGDRIVSVRILENRRK
jgi:cyclophilin family peptidyl-prolyl cis-trans isomerase/HEAT repeat protein